jgi:hypothetical protein
VLVGVLVPLSLFVAGCGGSSGGTSAEKGVPPADQQKKMMESMQKNMGQMSQQAKQGAGSLPAQAPR